MARTVILVLLNFRWVGRPGTGSPGRSRACPHQEDHGTKGRETAVASGFVLDGRDEPVPGFGKTLRNPRLRPGDSSARTRRGREGSLPEEGRSTLKDADDARPAARATSNSFASPMHVLPPRIPGRPSIHDGRLLSGPSRGNKGGPATTVAGPPLLKATLTSVVDLLPIASGGAARPPL